MLRNCTYARHCVVLLFLNEVLSLNAQEYASRTTASTRNPLLNEVLSLNAQE